MKSTLVITFFFLPLLVFGQSDSSFLMYDRILGYGYNQKHELVSIDTSFSARGVLTTKKSNAYSKDFYIINNRAPRSVKWAMKRIGNSITLVKGNKVKIGVIVNDSTLNWRHCCNDSVEFFIVPISKGIAFTPFNGQLILDKDNYNGKIILNNFDQRGLQNTSALYKLDSFAIVYDGTTRYRNDKYNNLISLGTRNEFIQLTGTVSDSIMFVNYFTGLLRKGERLQGRMRLLKRPFPNSQSIEDVEGYLHGNWTVTGGLIFDDSTNHWRKLYECNYTFIFSDDSLLIKRKFGMVSFDEVEESTSWTVNPTGEYIFIHGRSSFANPNIVLMRQGDNRVIFILQDLWTITGKREKKVSLVLEARKN